MFFRKAFFKSSIVFTALLVLGSMHWSSTAQAELSQSESDPNVQELRQMVNSLQDEVRDLRQQQETIHTRLPSENIDFVSQSQVMQQDCNSCSPACGPTCAPTCETNETSCGNCCGCRCGIGCYSCLCPLPQAPCVDCPRVTTLNPYFNVNVFGALKLDMLFSGARPVAPGTPFYLASKSIRGYNEDTVDIHARQSQLGAVVVGPQFCGFQSGGQILAFFYNDAVIVDQYGFLPLQAWGELKNDRWRFSAGLQFDVFCPGLPTVLPFTALAATGNTGNTFRGQVRLERYFKPTEARQVTFQFALSEPINTAIDPTFGLSEDNGWPNVEGRVALGLGCMQTIGGIPRRPFEVGISGLVGQIRTTPPLPDAQVVTDTWGVSADWYWLMTQRFGVAGEVYTGQTLGDYNGGILQNINPDTLEGIHTTGGWLEMFAYWTPCLESHVGYGIDDPIDRDITVDPLMSGRIRNEVYYANLLWNLNPTFRIGFEMTWRETNYASLLDNEGAGFHTQFQWAF